MIKTIVYCSFRDWSRSYNSLESGLSVRARCIILGIFTKARDEKIAIESFRDLWEYFLRNWIYMRGCGDTTRSEILRAIYDHEPGLRQADVDTSDVIGDFRAVDLPPRKTIAVTMHFHLPLEFAVNLRSVAKNDSRSEYIGRRGIKSKAKKLGLALVQALSEEPDRSGNSGIYIVVSKDRLRSSVPELWG